MELSAAPSKFARQWRSSWPVTACSIILVLAIAAAVAWGALDNRDRELKDCARMAARYELMRLHWKALETQRDFVQVIDGMFDETALDMADSGWKTRIIGNPANPKTPVNKLEAQAIKQIEAGKDEVWQPLGRGNSLYVRAFRATENCIVCHLGTEAKRTQPKDIIGVISLESVPRREE